MERPLFVLRLWRLLELAFRLLLPLLFLACLENSSVRWNPALAGVAVGCLVTGLTDELRSDPGGGLLLLNALLVVGGDAIALPQIRLRKTELTSLLPDLGVRMEVRMLVVGLPGIMIARLVLGRRDHLQRKTDTSLELVVDPLGLRARRMMTGLVPSSRQTLPGMTHSGLSWASYGSFMTWRNLQVCRQLGAKLLLHRLTA